jgi:flagellar biosynthetic protein FliP
VPVREFMLKQTREKDLALFVSLAKIDRPRTADDIPTYVLVPAFVIGELKTAFQMGFLIFVPFLIIDIVVSSTLMSMGMLMLPPVMISLPFKLLLFVMVDGWHLIVKSLVESFVT